MPTICYKVHGEDIKKKKGKAGKKGKEKENPIRSKQHFLRAILELPPLQREFWAFVAKVRQSRKTTATTQEQSGKDAFWVDPAKLSLGRRERIRPVG